MELDELLRLKVRLLIEGATLPEGAATGRKGGAGPVGARYFVLPNGRPCGVPIRSGPWAERYGSSSILPIISSDEWEYDSSVILKPVHNPAFYDLTTADGIPYKKIALLHGPDCLATTVYQHCKYWSSHEQCGYCTIPFSHLSGNTIIEKTPEQVQEVVTAAEDEGIIKHILLTTGTPDSPDMGINRLEAISYAIREVSDLPIAVQFEPPKDLSYIDKLADSGVNSIGIHLESADESVRERVCPGKFRHGKIDLYQAAWERALEFIKPGDVNTFILLGLGEDLDKTLRFCEEIAHKGVLPIITPIRPAPGSKLEDFIPSYVGALDETVEFYKSLGVILNEAGLDPRTTSAGCSRCGGCTPIQEAFELAQKV
ncbi:MAG: radical SAM protein [Candidatus Thorarchaeota archaeon]